MIIKLMLLALTLGMSFPRSAQAEPAKKVAFEQKEALLVKPVAQSRTIDDYGKLWIGSNAWVRIATKKLASPQMNYFVREITAGNDKIASRTYFTETKPYLADGTLFVEESRVPALTRKGVIYSKYVETPVLAALNPRLIHLEVTPLPRE